MSCGIYRILNLINGKSYIGQSVNIERRWNNEKAEAFRETSHTFSYPLSRAIRKYGVDNFSFEIVQLCSKDELNALERYWISKENSFMDGYNQTLGGDSYTSAKSESVKGVFCDLHNEDLTQMEISKKWGISEEMVQGINTGRYWFSDDIEYPIRKSKQAQKYYCEVCGSEISRDSRMCISCYKENNDKITSTPIDMKNILFENNGNFSKVSKMFGVSSSALHKWCKRNGIPNHSRDYKQRDVE